MKKIKNRDSQALSWLSGPRTDVSAESPLIGTDLSKGKKWRKSVDILPKVLSKGKRWGNSVDILPKVLSKINSKNKNHSKIGIKIKMLYMYILKI